MSRTAIKTDWITREKIRANPDIIYLFGDNLTGKGMGGQAREARGEPNAIGIPTKKKPSMGEDAFFTDDEYGINCRILDKAFLKIPADKDVVVPTMGTGLALLPEKAPKTFAYLQKKIQEL